MKLPNFVNRKLQRFDSIRRRLNWFLYYCFYKPTYVQVETTIACNLKCIMCNQNVRKRSKKFMTIDEFRRIINQFAYATSLNLTGIGEPLLNKDLFEMIKFARSKNIKEVWFATNATMLDAKCAKKLISSGLTSIIFSLDAATPELYEKIRVGADFYQVIENIKKFMNIKREVNSKFYTQIYMVGMEENKDQIVDMINIAIKLGVNHIRIQGMYDQSGKDPSKTKSALWRDGTKNRKLLEIAREKAKRNGVSFYYSPLEKASKEKCAVPWRYCYITVEGCVTPCCMEGVDPRNVNFGNLLEEDFSSIWNNYKYRDFRSKLASSNPPDICKNCPRLWGMA